MDDKIPMVRKGMCVGGYDLKSNTYQDTRKEQRRNQMFKGTSCTMYCDLTSPGPELKALVKYLVPRLLN